MENKTEKPCIGYGSVVRLLDEKEKRVLFDLLFQSIGHDRKRMAEIMGVTKSATYYYDSSNAAPSFEHTAIILAELLRLARAKGDKYKLNAQAKYQLGLILCGLRKRFFEANNSINDIEFIDLLTPESPKAPRRKNQKKKQAISFIPGSTIEEKAEDALKVLQEDAAAKEQAEIARIAATIRRLSETYPKNAIEYAARTYSKTGEKNLRDILKIIIAAGWDVLEAHDLLGEAREKAEKDLPILLDYRLKL